MTTDAAYLLQEYLNATVVLKPHREAIDPRNWEEGEAILVAPKPQQAETLLLAIEHTARNVVQLRPLRDDRKGQESKAFAQLAGENPALVALMLRLTRRHLLDSAESLLRAVDAWRLASISDNEMPYRILVIQLERYAQKQPLSPELGDALHHWRGHSSFHVVAADGLSWTRRLDALLEKISPPTGLQPSAPANAGLDANPEEAALVDAIIAQHGELGPRQVYADWLADHGDPRGELVRLECEMEAFHPADAEYHRRRSEWVRRWKTILRDAPTLPDNKHAPHIRWSGHRGGLLETAIAPPALFTEQAAALFARFPSAVLVDLRVNHFQAQTSQAAVGPIVACPYWSQVVEARLPASPELQLPLLKEAPWARVRALHVPLTSPLAAEAVAQNPALAGMQELLLAAPEKAFAGPDAGGVRNDLDLLSQSAGMQLETLVVMGARQEAGSLSRLLASPAADKLRRLHLQRAGLEMGDFEALAGWSKLPQLSLLNLSGNQLRDDALRLLLGRSVLPQFEHLDLSSNLLTNGAAGLLVASPAMERVSVLQLDNNKVGATGVKTLMASSRFRELRHLSLVGNPLGVAGVQALASLSAERFPKLRRISLESRGLTSSQQAKLKAETPQLYFIAPRGRKS
ncbi:TIGR02996 domain-containing protein [Lignipirellula cremea]|uniref:Leucine Rich repeats (2 copies) n=1 Tax=Lignipirellula cremea TaxID=2528010 RepID=A0A518E058_9BACT|nr:TIGR02996 domain-containing protein [Lignipirellula cremea]QDU97480.1 Leucine Rich repeats (2 copies) [Lignipirellula cremea]